MNEASCRVLVKRRACVLNPAWHDRMDYLPCESCGQWGVWHEMHHRKFRSRGGVWSPSNVVLICRLCHKGATDEAPWVTGSGLNVHSFEEPTEVPVNVWYAEGLVFLDDEGGYRAA